VLGIPIGLATYFVARSGADDPEFKSLADRAADRYVSTSITAWEFARGKLKGDPLYRQVLVGGVLPSGGTLVDVGCGQGLTLALLAETAATQRAGHWPESWPPSPTFDSLIGIEVRPRVGALASRALGDAATIVVADARHHMPNPSHAILFFDVLHMIPSADQEQLLAAAVASLDPDGVILVREPDAAAGWRFTAVRLGNALKALMTGNWRQRFAFRTLNEWTACFERLGLRVNVQGAGEGTPFANELFVLTVSDRAPGSARQS
jgi:SAM-dependent methyltransferase